MSWSTYTITAKTVQAQTITAIGTDLKKGQHGLCYTLSDGTILPAAGIANRFGAGYVAKVGDYVVMSGNTLFVWPAAQFLATYSIGSETVTVKNSAGSVSRTGLAVVAGVVTLAATDAIVTNGASVVLHKSDGTVSSGNATLNSPATVEIAAGVVTDVKASA